MATKRPNNYPGNCRKCGVRIEAQAGLLGPKVDGRWTVEHAGSCPSEAPKATTQPRKAQVDFTPTAEQAECVTLFATGQDLVIQAGAGAGKTSTLRLLAQQADSVGRRGQYCAYNKAIVTDVSGTMPGNVNCSTMHSLAYRAIGHAFKDRLAGGRQRADDVARILDLHPVVVTVEGEARTLAAGWLASKVLGAIRNFAMSADAEVTTRHFDYIEGIDGVDDQGHRLYTNNRRLVADLLPYAQAAWADLTDVDGRLRFTHDIYLKLWSLSDPRIDADFVMLDEAQDADPVQHQIVLAQRAYGTQVVVVGDEQQVLYEWRGAVNAMAQFEAMGANVAFLSQSFRFGNAVAEVANGLLTRLQARLVVKGFGALASVVAPIADPDCVLTRTNAGAVRIVLAELAKGRRTHLVGGSAQVVAFCRAALDLQDKGRTAHPELAIFSSWTAVQEYVADEANGGGDLKLMVKLIDEFTAEVIIEALDNQPTEAHADLVVSTAHKSKGREWNRVQIGGDFFAPKDPTADLAPAELRLAYVACTRAKHELDLTNVPHFQVGWVPGARMEGEEDI